MANLEDAGATATPLKSERAPIQYDIKTVENVKAVAKRFEVGLQMDELNYWHEQLHRDPNLISQYVEWLKHVASGLYPQFEKQITAGVEPGILLAPYRQLAEREIGTSNEDDIQTYLYEGAGTAGTLSGFRQYLRSLPEWEDGPEAQRLAGDLVSRLGGV